MRNIAFLCDNFGPLHLDLCNSLAEAAPENTDVIGIELFSRSSVYSWGRWRGSETYKQVTLADGAMRSSLSTLRMAWRIVSAVRKHRVKTILFAHYERPYIFISAIILRLLGRTALIMSDSKFDDYTRYLWRELGKSIMMAPYQGGIAASLRCADYIRFLGINPKRIGLNSYAIEPGRIRAQSGSIPAPDGLSYESRNFLSIARLVPKKNHLMLLEAYSLYLEKAPRPRRLVLCGSGEMEPAIRRKIHDLGLNDHVDVKGNLLPGEVSRELGQSVCLLLPSTEEQFGIVVLEAQAMGLPVILSDNCGARDLQVRNGVNGFVVESDNPRGMAYFMREIAENEPLWTRMCREALLRMQERTSDKFAKSVLTVARIPRRRPSLKLKRLEN